ncbi:hypothetical protein LAWI1_G003742 [Lachnellula willkommii]|uniref:Heterokaryon incompatibility domain-containing protein n=1 Tax=Lachnellula willkommii TaxID=215461 RepID=A0A559M9B2_9HELO|nr:hypothetical protein LAWI1_G003742 [Lachnellula willkommii]
MSAESFGKLQNWIGLCDKHHACMRWARLNGVPRSVPSRLLDMDLASDPPRIRLVTCDEIAENEPRYATLSHCWGGNSPFRLLQSNLEEMKSGIPFREFPKTFQEAIFVARKLGFSYLWIDAVCIVQDSHQDWTQQANSADSAGGLGRDRNPQAVQSVYAPCLNHDDTNPAGWFCYGGPRFEGHLTRRGWVLQERFLSPRVVHYLGNQIGWEFSESMTSEGLSASFNLRQNAVTLFEGLNTSIADTDSNGATRIKNVYVLWDTLVMRYASGHLTFSSDRPIAIAGVARVVCRHLDLEASDFHCGLWGPRFADGLAWRSVDTSQEQLARDPLFGIPSWSWLSVDGEVWQDHTGRYFRYKTPIEVLS